jgi:hypothetical protein
MDSFRSHSISCGCDGMSIVISFRPHGIRNKKKIKNCACMPNCG